MIGIKKAMAKKGRCFKSKTNAGKSTKRGMYKALRKEEKRLGRDKSDPNRSKRKAKVVKRPTPVSDDFRNFDERMAAKKARRTGLNSKAVSSSTFVMAAPTFQFNAKSEQREVEGFHGFLSALEAPKDSLVVNPKHFSHAKKMQPEYHESNAYAVLDNGDEEQLKAQPAPQPAPAFMEPPTFTFTTTEATFTLQTSLQLPLQSSIQQSMQEPVNAAEIDPDL